MLNKHFESSPKKPIRQRIISTIRSIGMILLFFGLNPTLNAQSLEDYKSEATRNNPNLKAAYFDYLASLEQVPQVGSLPDPELGFAWFILPVETRLGPQQARISVTQMLPWFGSRSDQKSSKTLSAKAKFEAFKEIRNQIFYQMDVIWADMFETSEKIRLAKENLEIVHTLVNVSLRKYETGLVPQVDVLRAQIEQEDLKTKIELLEDQLDVFIIDFNTLRNVDLKSDLSIPTTLFINNSRVVNEEQLQQNIRTNNPSINALKIIEQKAETDVKNASNLSKPVFGIGLDYIATGKRTDVPNFADNGQDALIARFNIKLPLFRAKNRSITQEARYTVSESRDRVIAQGNELERTVYSVLRNLDDAERRFELYDVQQIQRVQQAVNVMVQSYASDNSDFEEIIRLQRKLFDYELERIRAKSDQFKAIAKIDYLSGGNNITPQDINY